ncbi:zeta toxin family protein [Rossellomorea aquimaris]|uniref:zeta toxin family protein n=1 Tax=Rossellomorea aquimaris TaxID=189382 RepID=UPI001CFC4F3E|nr:zeta toxin family protein [Rossellomorea aquimaris]
MKAFNHTKEIYYSENAYHDDRNHLHKDWLDYILNDQLQEKTPLVKRAILLGGGAGVGKSQAIMTTFPIAEYVLINPDTFKEMTPEYKALISQRNPVAASFVHKESRDIAHQLFDFAVRHKQSIVYDSTLSYTPHAIEIITQLKNNSYEINLIMVDADVEVALERTKARWKKEYRFVPENIVRDTNIEAAISFFHLKNEVDMYTVIRNNSRNFKEPYPIVIKRDKHSTEEILKPDEYETYYKKGHIGDKY